MKKHIHAAMAGVLMITPVAAFAADNGWSGQGEMGLAISKGNTDSQTLVGSLGLGKEDVRWTHSLGASFLYGKNDGVQNARRYEVFGTTGYRLNERSYMFSSLRNERDRFASNEYQWTVAAGYGHQLINDDTTQLKMEIGPGYRWAKLQGVRIHNNEAILRGFMDFSRKLTPTTSLYDTLLVEAGSDNTFASNNLGLQVQMTDALALKAGFEVRHNTDVLPGTKRTDTLTTVNVVYGF